MIIVATAGGRDGAAASLRLWRPRVRLLLIGGGLVALFASIFVPRLTVVALLGVALVAGLLISRRDEVTALTILLGVTFLIPANRIIAPMGQIGVPSVLIGGALLLLWFYARCSPALAADRKRQPIRFLALLLVVSTLGSYVAAHQRGLRVLEANGADLAVLYMASALGLMLFTADFLRDADRIRRVVQLFVTGSAFMAIVAALQYYGVFNLAARLNIPGLIVDQSVGSFVVERSGLARVSGMASHAIEYGVILGISLPLALYLALTATRRAKVFAWTMVVLIAGFGPLSVSRSGILAMIVGTLVYVVTLRIRLIANLLPFAVIGMIAMQAITPGVLGTIYSLFLHTGSEPSSEARIEDYPIVFGQWIERPLFGRGPGTYIPDLYRVLDNQYLLTLVSTGAVGIVALLAMFATGYSLARRVRWFAADESVRGLGQALAGAIAACAVSALTFDAFSFPMMFIVSHLLIGLSAALWRAAVRDRDLPAGQEIGSPVLTNGVITR